MPRSTPFAMPTAMKITGRTSSITNAFVNAVIPTIKPTDQEVEYALHVLGLDQNDLRCAYCGDKSTEWDHLNPLVQRQRPTGYISEIANLVPSCGKCNQSKGSHSWKSWIDGPARLSPKSRGVPSLQDKIARLEAFEKWRRPTIVDFVAVVTPELWQKHRDNHKKVIYAMQQSQETAEQIKTIVGKRERT